MRPISKSTLAKAFFSAWATVLLVICSSLMVSHWVALPVPKNAQMLINNTVSTSATTQDIKVFHILLKSCPCSRRIVNHLKVRPAIQGVKEYVVLVGSPGEMSEYDWSFPVHFDVSFQSKEEIVRKTGIESAPLLLVTQADAGLVYSGGYTNRKQGLEIQDSEIINAIKRGIRPNPLPVLGCAISKKLKSAIDPLGLKYSL
ncbi:MAG: hypothetical protein U0930_11320 [Pirellulales bacterium]